MSSCAGMDGSALSVRYTETESRYGVLRPRVFALFAVVVLCLSAGMPACADDAPQRPFRLGYESEGKVDASIKGCAAYVHAEVEWNKADTARGIRRVCAARQRHMRAYRDLQKKYQRFLKTAAEDKRLNPAAAIENIRTMFKACVDYKWNMTTGGHNIAIDITSNEIVDTCLRLTSRLLDETSYR